jgi:dipeptidyl aminopeptidase/acylaminoacyl peptidase
VKKICFFLFLVLSSIQSNALEHDFQSITKSGKAPLAIFIHGALDSKKVFSKDLVSYQRAGYSTLNINLPSGEKGELESDFFGRSDQFEVIHFVEKFITKNASKIDERRILVYGQSLGGVIAVRLVSDLFPEAKLILESTPLSLVQEFAYLPPENASGWEKAKAKSYLLMKTALFEMMIDGKLSEQQLEDRSILGKAYQFEGQVLLMYGTKDWRYPMDLLNAQSSQFVEENTGAEVFVHMYNGDHYLESRDALKNPIINEFLFWNVK